MRDYCGTFSTVDGEGRVLNRSGQNLRFFRFELTILDDVTEVTLSGQGFRRQCGSLRVQLSQFAAQLS